MKSWRADLHYNPADISMRDKKMAFLKVPWVTLVSHIRNGQRKTGFHTEVFPVASRGKDIVAISGPGPFGCPRFLDPKDLNALL
eukprot:2671885-Pyramimonas_sp.AAC.1